MKIKHLLRSLILVLPLMVALPAIAQKPERIAADTPMTTVAGNTFVAPAEWPIVVKGPATILEAPEGGSFVALVDISTKDTATADVAISLIRLVYEADPLLCPRCRTQMNIVSVIKDGSVIDKILAHLQYEFQPLPLAAVRPPPDTPPQWDSFSAD